MSQSFAFPTTLYLVPGALQALSDVSVNPGAPQDGYPLVWDNDLSKWVISTLPYSSIAGAPALPVSVANGGTGTQTGSITGTGALTFAAGGTNNNIQINTTGTGQINAATMGLAITQPTGDTFGRGVSIEKGAGYFKLTNASNKTNNFVPSFEAKCFVDEGGAEPSLFFAGLQGNLGDSPYGVITFDVKNPAGENLSSSHTAVAFTNDVFTFLISVLGNGDTRFRSTTESTLTTNGAVRVDGGVGIAKNLFVGGGRINFANLPTSEPSTVGDLWRDGNVIKVKI